MPITSDNGHVEQSSNSYLSHDLVKGFFPLGYCNHSSLMESHCGEPCNSDAMQWARNI